MLSLLNTTAARHSVLRDPLSQYLRSVAPAPTPDYVLDTPTSGVNYALTDTGFDTSVNGGSVIVDFTLDDWKLGSTQGIFQCGDGSNYIAFWLNSNGVIRIAVATGGVNQHFSQSIFRRNFNVTGQRGGSAHHRIGFTLLPSGEYYCAVDGMVASFKEGGVSMPPINTSGSIGIGRLLSNGYNIHSGFVPKPTEFYHTALSAEELLDATRVTDLIVGEDYDKDLFFVSVVGQSNGTGTVNVVKPTLFNSTALNSYMMRKDMNFVAYSSPYGQLAPSTSTDTLEVMPDQGGWSSVDYILDTLGNKYPDKKFASVCGAKSGTGFAYDGGAGKFDYVSDSYGGYTASPEMVASYMYMLAAYQKGNLLPIVYKGGETDGMTVSTATNTSIKTALDRIDRNLAPLAKGKAIVNGLHAQPSSGYTKWSTSNTAMMEWSASKGYPTEDNSSFPTLPADDLHLNGDGQQDVGEVVVARY